MQNTTQNDVQNSDEQSAAQGSEKTTTEVPVGAPIRKKTKIVVVGAGFGGVYTAKNLVKKLQQSADIELINVNNYFVFQPLLPEVASGTLSAQDAVVPLRALMPGVRVRQAEVMSIDRENNVIHLLQGSRQTLIELQYDHLVLSSGVDANSSFVQGMESHAMTIKNLSDALCYS